VEINADRTIHLPLLRLVTFLPNYATGGLEGLRFDSCKNLIGPVVEGTVVPNGARVPGTPYQLDPIRAAFNIGTMIRWLDYNGMRFIYLCILHWLMTSLYLQTAGCEILSFAVPEILN
jgi:hypothetical protein